MVFRAWLLKTLLVLHMQGLLELCCFLWWAAQWGRRRWCAACGTRQSQSQRMLVASAGTNASASGWWTTSWMIPSRSPAWTMKICKPLVHLPGRNFCLAADTQGYGSHSGGAPNLAWSEIDMEREVLHKMSRDSDEDAFALSTWLGARFSFERPRCLVYFHLVCFPA